MSEEIVVLCIVAIGCNNNCKIISHIYLFYSELQPKTCQLLMPSKQTKKDDL